MFGDRQRGSAMEGVGENWTRFFFFFFQVFKNLLEKTRLKRGKSPEKTRLKPGKNLLENVESTQKVGDLVHDVVTDRGRTAHVPARGKTRFNFSPTPSSPTPFGRSRDVRNTHLKTDTRVSKRTFWGQQDTNLKEYLNQRGT